MGLQCKFHAVWRKPAPFLLSGLTPTGELKSTSEEEEGEGKRRREGRERKGGRGREGMKGREGGREREGERGRERGRGREGKSEGERGGVRERAGGLFGSAIRKLARERRATSASSRLVKSKREGKGRMRKRLRTRSA